MNKIERSKVVELVEKSGKWVGTVGSGTGTNWDLLVFENESGEELKLTHYDNSYHIRGWWSSYDDFVYYISNL